MLTTLGPWIFVVIEILSYFRLLVTGVIYVLTLGRLSQLKYRSIEGVFDGIFESVFGLTEYQMKSIQD